MQSPHIAIVGAGITGLTTAYHLRRRGLEVTVFEASETPGGRIQSTRRDGYLLERGPHTIMERNRATADLIDALGLESEMVVASDEANRRYVVRESRPRAVPMGPKAFLDSDLLSREAKLRLLLEPFIPRGRDDIDESLGNFIRRRLGEEILDYAVGPIIGGIYAGQPRLLSARHAFETAWEMERDYGSLAAGGLVRLLERIVGESDEVEGRLFSFQSGSGRLVERLADEVEDDLEKGIEIQGLERTSEPPRAEWRLRADEGREVPGSPFQSVVWTAPAYEMADLDFEKPSGIESRLESFEEVEYPPVTIVSMGVDREHVEHPLDGFGMLVPEPEPHSILGTLFMSSVFPGRAPKGRALLSTFVGGARDPEAARAPEEVLIERVREELRELIGLRGPPELVDVYRWDRAIPQYEVGYGRLLDTIEQLEADHPGLHLAGSFRDGVAVPDLIEAGTELAEALGSAHVRETSDPREDRARGAA